MKKVYIISPYRGNTAMNTYHATLYCRSAIKEGYLPIAPHLYFPQMLDDNNEVERYVGMSLGIELLKGCDEAWVYGEPSEGMKVEIAKCEELGIRLVYKDVQKN